MPLPPSVGFCTIRGTYLDFAGRPATGQVVFTSPTPLLATAEPALLLPTPVIAPLVNGTFDITLPASDDPDVVPNGWTYLVTEQFTNGQTGRTFHLQARAGQQIDLVTAVPVAPVTPTIDPVVSVNGQTGAVILDADDVGAVPAAGGTITGSVIIGDGGIGRSLTLRSSFAGGEDNAVGLDSTNRINLYSYQRAAFHSFGETIRHYLMRSDAKAMIAWYGPANGYDSNRDAIGDPTVFGDFKPWAWCGAHYEANDHGSVHGHWSVEVPDAAGQLQTRLEIMFADRQTGSIGLNHSFIVTNQADLVVRQSGGETLRLTAPSGVEKSITFANDAWGDPAFRRWKLRSTSTAETGSGAGNDFQLVRYNDAGVAQDSPLQVLRSNGQVQLISGGGVLVSRNTGTALAVAQTGPGATSLLTTGADAATRTYQTQLAADTTGRMVVYADGSIEWGPGNAARDTNLYRSAADTLKTDDSFHIGGAFRHLGTSLGFYNAIPAAKPTVNGSRANPEQALAALLTALAGIGLIANSTTA
ncbi:hypothetical protein ACQEVF_57055 [Nonomuraea polychroma]|uniref:hypothetical protein n=1 Tax=Nonomuraea polychroma TaxID=46176 RepID=UPI003D944E3E